WALQVKTPPRTSAPRAKPAKMKAAANTARRRGIDRGPGVGRCARAAGRRASGVRGVLGPRAMNAPGKRKAVRAARTAISEAAARTPSFWLIWSLLLWAVPACGGAAGVL